MGGGGQWVRIIRGGMDKSVNTENTSRNLSRDQKEDLRNKKKTIRIRQVAIKYTARKLNNQKVTRGIP